MPGYNIVGCESNLDKGGAKNSQLPSGSTGDRWLERVEGIRLDSHPLISYIGQRDDQPEFIAQTGMVPSCFSRQ
ncbi:MAG: hypothetical protein AMJ94_13150 [Deltaproteobacteria bacterium SM23_61]|nr:MAG: hypothetical protein AMJ94_13150 [Deltaproteobacteria bacterium SM23_61]